MIVLTFTVASTTANKPSYTQGVQDGINGQPVTTITNMK